MSRKIREAIDQGVNGFLIKDSIFLPFHMELISV